MLRFQTQNTRMAYILGLTSPYSFTLDINTTVSTWPDRLILMSWVIYHIYPYVETCPCYFWYHSPYAETYLYNYYAFIRLWKQVNLLCARTSCIRASPRSRSWERRGAISMALWVAMSWAFSLSFMSYLHFFRLWHDSMQYLSGHLRQPGMYPSVIIH